MADITDIVDNKFSPYEVSEAGVNINGKTIFDDGKTRAVWERSMILWMRKQHYYNSLIRRGKQLYNYYMGKIFTRKQLDTYRNVQDKFPVQPRIMKAPINALIGQIINGKRSGMLTSEGGSYDSPAASAEELELANIAMKKMEQNFNERSMMREMLLDGLVSCYPTWTILEKRPPVDGVDGKLTASLLPWDSVFPGPIYWRRAEDIHDIDFLQFMSTADLIENYPWQEDVIKNHATTMRQKDTWLKTSMERWQGTLTALDADRLMFDATSAFDAAKGREGLHKVVTRLYPIRQKEEIAFDSLNPKNFVIRPGEWEDDRWAEAVRVMGENQNTEMQTGEREVNMLQQTVFSTSGIVLDNRKHWFQEQVNNEAMLPGAMFVPLMANGVPTGAGDDMSEYALKHAVFETEFLNDVRKGSSQLLALRSGMIENISSLPAEIEKGVGVAIVKRDAPINLNDSITNIDRRPNSVMLEYSEKIKRDMEEITRINTSIQGQVNTEQSGIGKQLEIGQGMITQSHYTENANEWWKTWNNVKARAIPYAFTEHDFLSIVDEETGDTVTAEVNVPRRDMSGEVKSVANDLSVMDLKWVVMPVDDSPTAKMQEWQQSLIFLNTAAPALLQADPTGKLLARFMMVMPNRFLKDAGRALAQDAEMKQQQMTAAQQEKVRSEAMAELLKAQTEQLKAQKQGTSLSISGEDLVQFPQLAAVLEGMGFFGNQQQQAAPGMQQQAPAQQQAPQPEQPAPAAQQQELPLQV